MYQPRRALEAVATPAPEPTSPFAAPRRALPRRSDLLPNQGSLALAVVTASATAGAVLIGSNGGPAAAVAVPAGGPVATSPAPALTADEIAGPLARKTALALVAFSRLYATASLNVRAEADSEAEILGRLAVGDRVSATGDLAGKYRQIEFDDGFGWVLAAELSDAVPVEAEGTTMAECSRGSRVENRLRDDTVHIYRSLCALFPAVNSYGGWRAGGRQFHKNGRALDIMLTPRAESALGWRITRYLIEHAREFNIDHIIFEQKIWTPNTPRWRHMADRGGITANHFDHVHVAINA